MRRLALFLLCSVLPLFPSACARESKPEPVLLLRYADNQPEDYPTTKAAQYFADLVEERSGGKVVIRVFPDARLGEEISVFEQMQFGGIDFSRFSVGTLAEYVPEINILRLPYLFEDADHMWRILDGEIGGELLESIRSTGVVGMSWFDAGTRNLYTRTMVRSLDDLSGMTIRVQESDFLSRIVSLWGAEPIQLPYGSVYSALQTGRIDGAENNWPSYEATGHYEAAPYYLLDGHSRLPEVQIISQVTLEKLRSLDETYEDLILSCAREAALYERTLWQEREIYSEERVRSLGCVVTELSEEEKNRFREAVQPMYEGFSEPMHDLITRIQTG